MHAKARHGSWIVTLPLVAAAIVYVVLFFLPNRRVIADLHEQMAEKRDYISRSGGVYQDLLGTRQELDNARSFNAAWARRAPTERALPTLYGKINALAKAAGMSTARFDPDPARPLARIGRIPITIVCSGTFTQAYELMRGLESLPLSLWIESVKIKKLGENGETIECELKLVVFTGNQDNSGYVERSD